MDTTDATIKIFRVKSSKAPKKISNNDLSLFLAFSLEPN